jgi:hypothetical protein
MDLDEESVIYGFTPINGPRSSQTLVAATQTASSFKANRPQTHQRKKKTSSTNNQASIGQIKTIIPSSNLTIDAALDMPYETEPSGSPLEDFFQPKLLENDDDEFPIDQEDLEVLLNIEDQAAMLDHEGQLEEPSFDTVVYEESEVAFTEATTISSFQKSTGDITELSDRTRFVRAIHPTPVQTPSQIPGLSAANRILTCFRIGEAINASAKGQRLGQRICIELYARVLHSMRDGPLQTFCLADVWSCPKKLGITLDARWVGWEGVEEWEADGRIFWEQNLDIHKSKRSARKCRAVGYLERKAMGGWSMQVLSLWEADWDDISFAKSIFCE